MQFSVMALLCLWLAYRALSENVPDELLFSFQGAACKGLLFPLIGLISLFAANIRKNGKKR